MEQQNIPSPDKLNFNVIFRRFLGALVWGSALAVGAYNLSVSAGVCGAFLGAFIGFIVGPFVADSKLRTGIIALGGVLLAAPVHWLTMLPVNSKFCAALFLPDNAYAFADGMTWFFGSLIFVTVLHALTIRQAWFMAVELAVITAAFISPLTGHRDGFISRPYFFVDPIWSQGYDPIPFFIALGVFIAGTLLFLSVGRFNKRSTLVDLLILLAIAGLVGAFLPLNKLNQLLPQQQQMSGEAKGDEEQQAPPPPEGGKDKQADQKPDKDNQDNNQGQSGQNQNQNQKDQDKDQSNQNNKQDDKQSDPKPVAVVVFDNDFAPPDGYYYFRQDALSMYNGVRLVKDTTGLADKDIATAFASPSKAHTNVLVPERHTYPNLKSVNTKVCLITPHTLPMGLLAPQRFTPANNPDASQFIMAYNCESLCFTQDLSKLIDCKVGNPAWSKDLRTHYTSVSADPRYKELTTKILASMKPEYRKNDFIKLIMMKLWLEKNSTYDTKVRVSDKNDVVAKFLFGDRVGYCVHLANSLAYLARTENIPCRVASGYASDARNGYGGSSLLLMSNNSHAWCEVYVDGLGWYPIDVSPAQSNCEAPTPPDADLQRMLGQIARSENADKEGKPQEPRNLQQESRLLARALGWALLGLVCLAIIASYVIKVYRRLAAHFGSLEVRLLTVYRAALDCMAEAGIRRRYGEAREDFAERLQDSLPALKTLTEAHMRKSLGSPQRSPKISLAELMQAYGSLKAQIRQAAPWWKRFLGLINPGSWWFVK